MEKERLGKKYYTNNGSKDNIIISIAGVHGIGKTTIFNLLKKNWEIIISLSFFPKDTSKYLLFHSVPTINKSPFEAKFTFSNSSFGETKISLILIIHTTGELFF